MNPLDALLADVSEATNKANNRGMSCRDIGFTLSQGALAMLLTCDGRKETASLLVTLGQDVTVGRIPTKTSALSLLPWEA